MSCRAVRINRSRLINSCRCSNALECVVACCGHLLTHGIENQLAAKAQAIPCIWLAIRHEQFLRQEDMRKRNNLELEEDTMSTPC